MSLAKDIVDNETGEVLFPCNTEITAELLESLFEASVENFETIYTNDLDSTVDHSFPTHYVLTLLLRVGSDGRNIPNDASRRAADKRVS